MRVTIRFRGLLTALCLFVAFGTAPVAGQQAAEGRTPNTVQVEPAEINMRVGESVQLQVTVLDADDATIDNAPVLYLPLWGQFWNIESSTWGFNLFRVSSDGLVTASKPGEYAVRVRIPKGEGTYLDTEVPLRIRKPPVTSIELVDPPARFLSATTVRLERRMVDSSGAVRRDVAGGFRSSDGDVAIVDELGHLKLLKPGRTTITAMADEASTTLDVRVEHNPAASISLTADANRVRTGDVVHLDAVVLDGRGNPVNGAPITFSFLARTDEMHVGGPTTGFIAQDGRFVADLPGEYSIFAHSGAQSATAVIVVEPRDAQRHIELVGHGRVKDRSTSDLWVWEAPNGRDYAITGTHSAEGHAYIWDVTDPANMVIVDTVHVDARTVNDVKVSEDGRIAVISREGASNRRNGIVILDVSDPAEGARVLSRYDDELTGGVHNLFVSNDHVYALSAGQRYDIISIEDPSNPHRVGRFELDSPARSIHDVWVADGIAYSANWNQGVVMVDVGGGNMGGSPRNPVKMGQFPFPSGWNHSVHPYRSASTGKFYILAGDEAARTGRFSPRPELGSGTPGYEGEPSRWRGWIHVLEWDPLKSDADPRVVARYEVPEAGSHNIWVENDVMYVAFYNGGLRVVDLSGELMGDPYRQGREIAYFLHFDPDGFRANAPQVWGAQPFKGNIFFSDNSSGLWCVRLVDDTDALAGPNGE